MAYLSAHNKKITVFALLIFIAIFALSLRPVQVSSTTTTLFEVHPGDGFQGIISNLHTSGLIRSSISTGL